MKPVKYKISLDNKSYGEKTFDTIEQITQHLIQLGLSDGFVFTLGYLLDPNEELKKHKQALGELVLENALNLVIKGISQQIKINQEDSVKVAELLLADDVLPNLTNYTGNIIKKIGEFKTGQPIVLPK